jgi:hypothetical protein
MQNNPEYLSVDPNTGLLYYIGQDPNQPAGTWNFTIINPSTGSLNTIGSIGMVLFLLNISWYRWKQIFGVFCSGLQQRSDGDYCSN